MICIIEFQQQTKFREQWKVAIFEFVTSGEKLPTHSVVTFENMFYKRTFLPGSTTLPPAGNNQEG